MNEDKDFLEIAQECDELADEIRAHYCAATDDAMIQPERGWVGTIRQAASALREGRKTIRLLAAELAKTDDL